MAALALLIVSLGLTTADAWSNIFEGLETVTQACPNNRLPPETPEHTLYVHPASQAELHFPRRLLTLHPTSSSSEELQLVVLAAESSSAAYANSDAQPGSRSPQILRSVEQATSAALDGSVKACALAIANSPTDRPLLAVAFRGTVSLADWLVNLDGGLEDCADFLGSPGATAHAGLLRVAKAMAPRVCEKIISASSTIGPDLDGGRPSLVITGHSAGGGVAGLISAHIRATRPDILDRFEVIHCVTFAAPPVLGSLPSGDDAPPVLAGLSLNIVNYGDMVPRADKAYIRSLLTLYRERAESNTSEPWDFGDPDAWNYGKNIVVMDVAAADDGGDIQDDVSDLRAFDVGPHIWKTLAFGSKKTHPMAVYLQSVRSLIRS